MNYYQTNELYHHGILGMKWGIRRYQNQDGSLTKAGRERYGAKDVKRLEKKAIKAEYKRSRKNGGNYLLKFARISTGENYNKAVDNFQNLMDSDKKYKELSKKAFKAEKDRLLYEKKTLPNTNDPDYSHAYYEMAKSKEYQQLERDSRKAMEQKWKRVNDLAKDYVDIIKEAKLDDLNISGPEREKAKQYISDRFYDFYWDENLEYNIDHYYEPWVDEEKFK